MNLASANSWTFEVWLRRTATGSNHFWMGVGLGDGTRDLMAIGFRPTGAGYTLNAPVFAFWA